MIGVSCISEFHFFKFSALGKCRCSIVLFDINNLHPHTQFTKEEDNNSARDDGRRSLTSVVQCLATKV